MLTLPRTVRAFILTLALMGAVPLAAQRPLGADTLSRQAVAESLTVLKDIRARLAKDRNNAALWYRRGMLAWALYDRDRTRGGLRELDWTLLGREADSSIRLASEIEPGNARYYLTKGQYYNASGWIPLRVQALHVFDVALRLARASGDSALLAEALLEKGYVHWRRYGPGSRSVLPASLTRNDIGLQPTGVRDRARRLARDSTLSRALLARDVDTIDIRSDVTRKSLQQARGYLEERFRRADGSFAGESDYIRAEELFREAYAAMPSSERTYRAQAALLAERERWPELASFARAQLRRDAAHPWAWLTLGVSQVRSGDVVAGRDALDRGFAFLPPSDQARLDRVERVLRPSDTLRTRAMSAGEHAILARSYWDWATPLWSRPERDPRTEFLARLAYAELRWTVGELRRQGADTDRGDVYARYGPPDARGGHAWWYDAPQLSFSFAGMATFGTAYFADASRAYRLADSIPALWDNIAVDRVDSLPVQIARFRGEGDSVDVVFATRPPVQAIQNAADLPEPVRVDFWLVDHTLSRIRHDSTFLRQPQVQWTTHRFAAGTGSWLYRFEASAESAPIAGRATGMFVLSTDSTTAFKTAGFGMSDVLFTTATDVSQGARRWRDFGVTPLPGALPPDATLTIVWENYELAERDGSASYELKITMERRYQLVLNRIRARVTSAFAAMMGSEETSDRVIVRYARTVPHAAVIPDALTLDLDNSESGRYDLTIEVTDRVTGKVTSTTRRLVIR